MNRSSGSQRNAAQYAVCATAMVHQNNLRVFSALTCDESVKLRFTRSRPYSLELEWVDGAGGNGWRVDGNGSRK